MNSAVSRDSARTVPSAFAALSKVRALVVPTAHTQPPAARVALIASAASVLTAYHSECITCSAGSSDSTGLNVPAPTCSTTSTRLTPREATASSSSGVKCSPAVGAATEPRSRAYTVW